MNDKDITIDLRSPYTNTYTYKNTYTNTDTGNKNKFINIVTNKGKSYIE